MSTLDQVLESLEQAVQPVLTEDERLGVAHLLFGGEKFMVLDLLLHSAAQSSVTLDPGLLTDIGLRLDAAPQHYKEDVEDMREQLRRLAADGVDPDSPT